MNSFKLTPDQSARLRAILSKYDPEFRSPSAVAKALDHNEMHVAALLRGTRKITEIMLARIARIAGLTSHELASALITESGTEVFLATPQELEKHAADAERAGEFSEAIKLSQQACAKFVKLEQWLDAGRMASLLGCRQRYLGAYKKASDSFDLAEAYFDKAKNEPNYLRQLIRNRMFKTWTITQTVQANYREAEKDFEQMEEALNQRWDNVSQRDQFQKEIDLNSLGRRIAEIRFLRGKYRESLELSEAQLKASQKLFEEPNHSLWASLGVARAKVMLNEESDDAIENILERLAWASQHHKVMRVYLYTKTTQLKWLVAKERWEDYDAVSQEIELANKEKGQAPSARHLFYSSYLKGVVAIVRDKKVEEARHYFLEALDRAKTNEIAHESRLARLSLAEADRLDGNLSAAKAAAIDLLKDFKSESCSWGVVRSTAILRLLGEDIPKIPGFMRLEGVDAEIDKKVRAKETIKCVVQQIL